MAPGRHEPRYRQITTRLVTVTCSCGFVRERLPRRDARAVFDHHERLYAARRPAAPGLPELVLELERNIARDLGIGRTR